MATKRTSAKKTSRKRKPTRTDLKKLLAKAQAKVANLLINQRAGTLAQVELKAQLEEIKGHLKKMEPFDRYHRH
jgi:hypothetical protein